MKKPDLIVRTSLTVPLTSGIFKRTPKSGTLTAKLLKTPRDPIEVYADLIRKAQKRNIKLDRFFGANEDRPRIDACTVREALDHGLAGCLSSKRVLSYFLLFLLEENLAEGLFFLLSAQTLERMGQRQFEELAEAASLIHDLYLHPAGLLHVEAITPTVKKISNDILYRCVAERSPSITMCFNAAKRQIWEVMEQVFSHFKEEQGPVFSLLNKSFEPRSVMWGPTALNGIAKRLLHHISAEYGATSLTEAAKLNPDSGLIDVLRMSGRGNIGFEAKRGILIAKLVISFLKEHLGVELAKLQL